MIPAQPVQLYKYLGVRYRSPQKGIKRMFYLSWEDAFWDLLDKKEVPKDSLILAPEFFCTDVEENTTHHGYKVCHYPTSPDLKINVENFIKATKKYKPRVIIIFHAVGITNNLFKDKRWLKYVPDETIIVEDSVHRIVNPKNIAIIKKNHFIIDSLRKVMPLQGSNLYGRSKDLPFSPAPFYQSTIYSLKTHSLWALMVIMWNLGRIHGSFGVIAERIMLKGYDIIGTEIKPASGLRLFSILIPFINHDKIHKIKSHQAEYYFSHIQPLIKLNIKKDDFGHLRAWPVILPIDRSERILDKIRSSGLLVRFELNGNKWSERQKIIYLPMGPHLKSTEIHEITKIVNSALRS